MLKIQESKLTLKIKQNFVFSDVFLGNFTCMRFKNEFKLFKFHRK